MVRRKATSVVVLLGVAVFALAATAPARAEFLQYPFGATGAFTRSGMRVDTVYLNSPVQQMGLRPGDWIVRLNGQLIPNQAAFIRAINASGGNVTMYVARPMGRLGTLRLVFQGTLRKP